MTATIPKTVDLLLPVWRITSFGTLGALGQFIEATPFEVVNPPITNFKGVF